MVHVRSYALRFSLSYLVFAALPSCAYKLAVGKAFVVTAAKTVAITTNAKTETISVLMGMQWSDDPDWTDKQRAEINKNRPSFADLIPVVSGGAIKGKVALSNRSVATIDTLQQNGIAVLPVEGSELQRVALVNEMPGDLSQISSGAFYVVMKVPADRGTTIYNVSFKSAPGKALLASEGTDFLISLGEKVAARATSVPNFFSIDALRKSALNPEILTGVQPNTKVVLSLQDNKLQGETRVTMAEASGMSTGEYRVIAPASADLSLNAGG